MIKFQSNYCKKGKMKVPDKAGIDQSIPNV